MPHFLLITFFFYNSLLHAISQWIKLRPLDHHDQSVTMARLETFLNGDVLVLWTRNEDRERRSSKRNLHVKERGKRPKKNIPVYQA